MARVCRVGPGGDTSPEEGVTVEVLAGGMPSAASGNALGLLRVTFAPGVSEPAHQDVGAFAIYVESGALTLAISEGEVLVTRAGAEDVEPERVGPGTEAVLTAGDRAFFENVTFASDRNEGAEPAVVLVAFLGPTGEEATIEATPA